MIRNRPRNRLSPLIVCLLCTGCSRAPSISIIGSFFPVWMLCAIIAVVIAFVVRALLALFYPSVVVLSACALWLIFFR
jgi:YtcA family